MYHTHKSTERHDKIFALLGMSSDDPFTSGLVPDYEIEWEKLVEKLVHFVLHENISYQLWSSQQAVLIPSKVRFLGQVTKVSTERPWYRQSLYITYNSKIVPRRVDNYKSRPRKSRYTQENKYREPKSWHTRWIFPASAKAIEPGDIVCLLERSSTPTIIRICENYFKTLMIAASPMRELDRYEECPEWKHVGEVAGISVYNAVLFWGWDEQEDAPQKLHLGAVEPKFLLPNCEQDDDSATQNAQLEYSQLLIDACKLKEAYQIIGKLVTWEVSSLPDEENHRLLIFEKFALLQRDLGKYEEAIASYDYIIDRRKKYQDRAHPQILESMSRLASVYNLKRTEKSWSPSHEEWEHQAKKNLKLVRILGQTSKQRNLTQKQMDKLAKNHDEEVMSVLVEKQGVEVVTRGLIIAALQNKLYGTKVLQFLLSRSAFEIVFSPEFFDYSTNSNCVLILLNHHDLKIDDPAECVYSAVEYCNKAVMERLMELISDPNKLFEPLSNSALDTNKLLEAAARNWDSSDVFEYLLSLYPHATLTPNVVKYAAGVNTGALQHAIERYRPLKGTVEVEITDDMLAAAASCYEPKNISMLLKKIRCNRSFSLKVWLVAARNEPSMRMLLRQATGVFPNRALKAVMESNNVDILRFLLAHRRREVNLTKEMINKAAAFNSTAILEFLFMEMGEELTITKDLVIAAAGTSVYWRGKPHSTLDVLFRQKNHGIEIDEDIVSAAVNSVDSVFTLLAQKSADFPVTEKVLEAACKSSEALRILKILVPKAPVDFKITEKMLEFAAGNTYFPPTTNDELDLIEYLHTLSQNGFQITKNVLKSTTSKHTEAVPCLVKYCPNESDFINMLEDGEVIRMAVVSGDETVVQFLGSKSNKFIDQVLLNKLITYTNLYKSVREHDGSTSRTILRSGIDFNLLAECGRIKPILTSAVEWQEYRTTKSLLELKSIDVDAQEENGNTALNFAAASAIRDNDRRETIRLVNLLLCYGADPSIANNKGLTPLGQILEDDEIEEEPTGVMAILKAYEGDIIQPGYVDSPFNFYAQDSTAPEIAPLKTERLRRSKKFYLHRAKSLDCLVAPADTSPLVTLPDNPATSAVTETPPVIASMA
jgi:hypothetical protein